MWTAQPAVDPSLAFGSGRAILDPPPQEEALSTAYVPTPGVAQLPARSIRERYLGALIGLAVGDALGATHQQQTPGSFEPISDLTGGGILNLPRGAWTDDTAMALCLAESLLESRGFDARDQVERYARWQQNGYMSATGEAVGITPNTARSIAMAQWRRQLFAGSHDPKLVEPTPLSRMAPAVMFYLPFRDQALEFAGDAVRTTCQAPLVLNVCRLFAAMVHAALEGQPKPQVLAPPWDLPADRPKSRIRGLIEGRYRAKDPAVIHAGNHILDTLELVLWAFERTDSFLEGALLVANAGESSDVAGAVYGQLAGAYYGVDAIPPSWRNSLIGKDLIESLALRLLEQTKVGQIK
jgi:ADP-ribosylglycohydrolase